MQFLKEIEAHLVNFETEAKEDIQKFIAYLYTKYQPTSEAVVHPPAPIAPNGELTIPSVVVADDTPVVLAQPTIVESTPVVKAKPVVESVIEELEPITVTIVDDETAAASTITLTTTCAPAPSSK